MIKASCDRGLIGLREHNDADPLSLIPDCVTVDTLDLVRDKGEVSVSVNQAKDG